MLVLSGSELPKPNLNYKTTVLQQSHGIDQNIIHNFLQSNRIGGVMVSVLASSAVDCGFEPRSGQTKDYEIGICCFSDKHASLRRNSK
jgi:hypothetical protein